MKKLVLVAVATFFYTYAFAQQSAEKVTELVIVEDNDSSDIHELVQLDQAPEFPGGIDGLMQFLSQNIVYPNECAEQEIQGRVLVKFTVFKDGKVGNIEVVNSVHPLLDAEAIRVVSLLPDWKPGKLGNENVNVWYTLPISFKLQDNSAPALSERDQADFNQFLELGQQAEREGNVGHAFQYYKECFNINPTDFSILDRIDKLMVADYEYQTPFYQWAAGKLLHEAKKGYDNSAKLLAKAVELWEKLLEKNPNDLETLGHMEYLYFISDNLAKTSATAQQIYPLIPESEVYTFASAMAMDANARNRSNDYAGIVSLVAPKVDYLLTQNADNSQMQWGGFFELAEAYIQLGKVKEAKALLNKLKTTYSDKFNELIRIYEDYNPEMGSAFQDLLK